MHLVVGLGNPGRQYEKTRHNAGFLVVDRLAARNRGALSEKQFGALVAKVPVAGVPSVLCEPQNYMNVSGTAVASLKGYYKVQNDEIVVVHDELDIPFGDVRVKVGGGHGGHNGLRDLVQKLGDGNFIRVRVGISRPPPEWAGADYVLSRWTSDEARQLDDIVDRAADAVETIVKSGVQAAMNQYNTKAKPKASGETAPEGSS